MRADKVGVVNQATWIQPQGRQSDLPPLHLLSSLFDRHARPINPATASLSTSFELDPLISPGAPQIGCKADSTDAILAALHDANITVARIGTVSPPSFGLQLRRDGHLTPLPISPVDEIASSLPNCALIG